jgi:hypothetical protein
MVYIGSFLALASLFGAIALAAFGYSLRHIASAAGSRRNVSRNLLAFASAWQFLLGQLNLSRALNDLRGQAIGFGRGGEL